MVPWSAAPATSAGSVVRNRSHTPRAPEKARPGSERSSPANRWRSMTTTARMAPIWMKISKVAARAPVNPRRLPATIRWPVDETGRNSVRPSTIPRATATQRMCMGAESNPGWRPRASRVGPLVPHHPPGPRAR